MNPVAKARRQLRLREALRLVRLIKTDDWRYYRSDKTDVQRTFQRNTSLPK